ncbi:MAG: hypothetical protein COY38_00350 [Candidatus Aenigmarchaeota archaeon CG_4_10_14_0_8_um_filter_37_24]|nr:hypothetical protein [Candidatus Aenigmarchaeota archaeon]OIN88622.1 MAG: hypothetical protein AUJ50_00295 [Candidatus Aenigmarchaeota archaeon CG1_02_38_14]PIV68513.1 MAG: hypothetical protein COS07_03850 [Candidatus Aenigmarchaeota archaeon CG01_land_8_20_14_3_00_37_9]PIW41124.1 MAG: hypothetical protein COW21_03555 [Candidatus Aenigmarchaeota archaeon CG15_BIG_FIL_POST_REV_8_21_14_020_37_27]PIX50967.1 MAG: hypothetical protein COZ52_01360 [Candidatus Aenigmarchaeota archaeon CG_4_8_14_3_u
MRSFWSVAEEILTDPAGRYREKSLIFRRIFWRPTIQNVFIGENFLIDMEVIIIHGSRTYLEKPRWLKIISYKLASYFCKELPSFDYAYNFRDYLKKKGIQSEVFEWSGSIWLMNIKKTSVKLNELLKTKKKKVILFCKSNGGLIAQFSSLEHKDKIKKIVQVASPNLSKKYFGKVPIVNIYSETDKTQRNGIILHSLLTFCKGSRILEGENVKNVLVHGNNHKDFNKKKIFDFYYQFIE